MPATASTSPATVTCRPNQAIHVFGVSRATIYRWAKAGHITLYHRGGMAFVVVDEVLGFITDTNRD